MREFGATPEPRIRGLVLPRITEPRRFLYSIKRQPRDVARLSGGQLADAPGSH
jgi:hypothetical protein